jgi:esterase/lipase
MDHVIRSNILAANNETDKLKLLNDDNYKKEMAKIKKASTAIINNNYDFKKDISNKIKSAIQI